MAEEPEQVLVEHRIAAARRIEEIRAEVAVGQEHRDRAGQAGSASSSRNAVNRTDQTNSGILWSVMPGARMLKMVVMKLIAPRIDEAPARCSERMTRSKIGRAHGGTRDHNAQQEC